MAEAVPGMVLPYRTRRTLRHYRSNHGIVLLGLLASRLTTRWAPD